MPPAGTDGKERGILRVHLVTEAFELEIAHDALLHEAGQVSARGDTIARPDRFRDRAAAENLAPLQHQHSASGAREIGSRNQAIVAAADDDGIVFGHEFQF